jgi:hypothetical protein
MKSIFGWCLAAIMAFVIWGLKAFFPPPMMFNTSGQINKQVRVFADKVAVTSANQSFNISSAGFTTVLAVSVQPQLNTATAANMPLADIQTYTPSSITVNFLQSNTQTISILGTISVGLQPLQTFTGDTVHIIVMGY